MTSPNPELRRIASDLDAEWVRAGAFAAADALGLKYQRRGKTALACCIWHDEKTPSMTIAIGPEGTVRLHCFGCQQTADMHEAVARVNRIDLSGAGFPRVLRLEAESGGRYDLIDTLDGKAEPRPRPTPAVTPTAPKAADRTYPPREEVLDLLDACVMTANDLAVATYLAGRALPASDVDIRGLAYALPKSAPLPSWARCSGVRWTDSDHRLIVPVRDHTGEIQSVRAWCIGRCDDGKKRLAPAAHTIKGLVLADAMAQEMLRAGAWPTWATTAPRVVICEGEPDFLTMALRTPPYQCPRWATLGVIAGSWCDAIAARIPAGAKVAIWTHHDLAGEKYAATIVESLRGKCECLRGKP